MRFMVFFLQGKARLTLLSELAPELVQPRVAAAAVDVELVAHRVFPVVILVIILPRPELARLLDRRHDRLLERLFLLPLRPGRLGKPLLLLVVPEDRRPGLRADA